MTLVERAEKVTPGGAQTRSKRATSFPPGYPRFLVAGSGARVEDSDGKRYIDWICGLASISLGYADPTVDNAVRRQMLRGVSFSLPTVLEVEAAEALLGCVPWAEQVRFVKTGSEATEGAMRIARLATGHDMVISVGYHGWHSVHDAASAKPMGVPKEFSHAIISAEFNDLQAVESIVSVYGPPAAVLVEPTRDHPPQAGYLEGLQLLCARTGALLIFDEVVTGFRWALAGASQYFGVTPDLACYGKGMANGYPVAAIVGKRDIMQHASYVSGTFGGEALSLAALIATIDVFQREPVIQHMWNAGKALMDTFNGWAVEGLRMTGYPCHPRIVGDKRDAFVAATATEGVLFHPAGFNVCRAHGSTELVETLAKCRQALERL